MTHTMTAMPKYESYKKYDIGELPTTWEIRRFRNVFTFSKGLSITKENLEDEGIPCINYGEIHSKLPFEVAPSRHKLKCVNEEYLKQNQQSLINKGDIIFADTSEDIEGSGNFSQLVENEIVFAGYHTIIARPNDEYVSRFLAYLLESKCYREQIQRAVKGVKVYSITNKILKSTSLWLPSKTEQSAIAMFLDEKTVQVDEVIGIKEQQIALLKERKQIIIQNAVTKGLNPTAPMKDSGFEWLGNIPEHWGVEKGKWLFKKENRPVQQDDEIITCFRDGEVTLRRNRRTDGFTNALQEIGYQRICVGDLVIHAMDAFAGAIGVSDSNGKSSPVYSACTPLKENTVDPYYYAYFLRNLALSGVILSLAKGIRERSTDFRFNDFGALQLSVPPILEQKEIVKYIDTECQKIETGISAQMEQIEKFKEYKASLINGAMTGKIKVI